MSTGNFKKCETVGKNAGGKAWKSTPSARGLGLRSGCSHRFNYDAVIEFGDPTNTIVGKVFVHKPNPHGVTVWDCHSGNRRCLHWVVYDQPPLADVVIARLLPYRKDAFFGHINNFRPWQHPPVWQHADLWYGVQVVIGSANPADLVGHFEIPSLAQRGGCEDQRGEKYCCKYGLQLQTRFFLRLRHFRGGRSVIFQLGIWGDDRRLGHRLQWPFNCERFIFARYFIKDNSLKEK